MLAAAGVVELVDTPALGAGAARCGGSSPSARMDSSAAVSPDQAKLECAPGSKLPGSIDVTHILHSLPKGERIGLAFSGGLDTSVAVAWIREKGGMPCTYTADLGQYDEPNLETVPARAKEYGAEIARLV